jgi:hypothetical protein
VLAYLADRHNLRIQVDRRAIADAALAGRWPITADECETLAHSLSRILAQHAMA